MDVCPTGLTTITTTLTATHCSCMARAATSPPAITIPMTVVEKVCTACGNSSAPSTLTVTVPITRAVQLGAIAASSSVAATATISSGAFRNAQPNQRNSTRVSTAVTVIRSTVVLAPAATPDRVIATAAGEASATGAGNGTSAGSITMFEGGAGVMVANLGMVLLGAVAAMML